MDKLLALRTFVATVRCGGFSAAARQLGLATSSVTRAVNALEQELGCVLLNRNTRQISVSEAGRDYFERALAILDALDEADAAVADKDGEVRGRLAVSVPVEFARRIIAPHLGKLLQRHPQLEVSLRVTDEVVDLLSERVDLALRLGSSIVSDDVVSQRVGSFRRWLVASPQYLACNSPITQPDALQMHACLQYDYGSPANYWRFEKDGKTLQVPVSGRLRSNNADILRQAALDGQGIALLSDWLVRDDVDSGKLQRLLPDYDVAPGPHEGTIHLLYLPNHRGSRRIAAFSEFLQELLQG
ncbi:LysR family transcriptional regulator [Ectopseudomonas mendocina]|uniref:LysR family transcriptional regulator n=1 Tax=Ectopseudomonas mendocina TaxID=300 RepID=UPI000206D902|nr:LysR family transcriptional regulator [Pseudomonas mendocina]AEB59562.1 transcriptional regulator, LysR family [Pseudomonas mendocina NK-01]